MIINFKVLIWDKYPNDSQKHNSKQQKPWNRYYAKTSVKMKDLAANDPIEQSWHFKLFYN